MISRRYARCLCGFLLKDIGTDIVVFKYSVTWGSCGSGSSLSMFMQGSEYDETQGHDHRERS